MSNQKLENEVREIIRKNRWLTLSTSSLKGIPQSSLVVYASDGYTIYIMTGKTTVKIRNILKNPRVSVTIPFYKNLIHRLITKAPPAAVSFKTKAETRKFSDVEATEFYENILNFKVPDNMAEEGIWIKLIPSKSVTCFGVGVSLLEFRNLEKSYKTVQLTR